MGARPTLSSSCSTPGSDRGPRALSQPPQTNQSALGPRGGSPAYDSPWTGRAPAVVGQPDSRANGWTGPAPASRSCPATVVRVQPDPRTSSTSSTGPPGTVPVIAKAPWAV